MNKRLLTTVVILLQCLVMQGQQHDPSKVNFITSDINNFWTAYDSSTADTSQTQAIMQRLYLAKGTYGLKQFDSLSIRGAANLAKAIRQHPRFYHSIRNNTLQIDRMQKQILASFVKLRSLYPAARFPDVYFLIGDLQSGGKSGKDALMIGAELFSADSQTVFDNIDSSFKKLLQSLTLKAIPQIVAHELIHYQQSYAGKDKDLLGYAVMEGSADFIARLITGEKGNEVLYDYGDKHERELWKAFEKDMHGYDINRWMYSPGTKDRPADAGYYIGYKIAESYYSNSKNKKQAIANILNIEDFSAFLRVARYATRHKK